jgi:hypothetical protein
MKKFYLLLLIFCVGIISVSCEKEPTIEDLYDIFTFENVSENYIAGPTVYGENLYSTYSGQYTSYLDAVTGLKFGLNSVEDKYDFWNGGIAISNWNDMTTAGYTNQCSVYFKDATTGKGGNNGSNNFGICNYSAYCAAPEISFDSSVERVFDHIYITNATYPAISMVNGDSFAKKLSYDDKDYFLLTVKGYDAKGAEKGVVEFYLADFRTTTSSGIITNWKKVDLSSLGAVNKITFSLTSSDNGAYGMNTPAYFCIDDIAIQKEVAE